MTLRRAVFPVMRGLLGPAAMALSLLAVSFVTSEARAYTLAEVKEKSDGKAHVERGKGLVKGFMARFKEKWNALKESAANLGRRAKAKFEKVGKQIRGLRKRIAARAGKLQYAVLQRITTLRHKARTLVTRDRPSGDSPPTPAIAPVQGR